jgi:hypothetical protein
MIQTSFGSNEMAEKKSGLEKQSLFVSHSSEDAALIGHFTSLLNTISGSLIVPWYSSDERPSEGLVPGDEWFNKIRENINKGSAVIALITKNSISNN